MDRQPKMGRANFDDVLSPVQMDFGGGADSSDL